VLPGAGGRLTGLVVLAVVLSGVAFASVRYGSVPLEARVVLDALTRFDPSLDSHLIVRSIRLPRTLIGLGVGAALALAGAALQTVTRNALADPGILGVNTGASFAVVTAVYLAGISSPVAHVWFAFAGAAVTTVGVWLVASAGRGGPTPVKLALAGAVVTALLGSWISAVLLLSSETLDVVRFWLAGSLAGRDVAVLWSVAPFLVVGVVLVLGAARQLDVLALGDDVARGLGQRTGLVRATIAVATVLLAGAAVAAAGPVGFVGLAVPHAVRGLVGVSHRWVLPYCVVAGPTLLLAADVVGRIVMRPGELAVGIVTALVGAPVLIVLARRRSLDTP